MAQIQVRATQKGFYLQYRIPGDVFTIDREGAFSQNWMERISPKAAEPVAVAPKAEPVAFTPPAEPVVATPEPERQKRKYVRKVQ